MMDLRLEAEKRADAKIKFEENLYKYLIANTIIAVICFVFLQGFSLLFFVMFFWGIAVLDDFFKAYPFGEMVAPNYREKMVDRELSKMGE
ncbi:MAG: 2TM domain-containing protein [Methanobrevibacter sp.]|nr:2TM domain-containing protein [Methanobrevibacter sp.]MBE6490172.1 2TM domain-containing protein [Methanobrevibacter sp.]MEE0936319.1 2TM domain-containing protein [Methanobrevibacter sp.]